MLNLALRFAPSLALAAEDSPPAASIFTAANFAMVLSTVAPFLAYLVVKFWASQKAGRLELVKGAVVLAYNIVSEASLRTTNTVDDKVAMGLKAFKEALEAQGIKPTPAEESLAQMGFKALHGAEKKAEALAPAPVPQPPL